MYKTYGRYLNLQRQDSASTFARCDRDGDGLLCRAEAEPCGRIFVAFTVKRNSKREQKSSDL